MTLTVSHMHLFNSQKSYSIAQETYSLMCKKHTKYIFTFTRKSH